MAKTNSTSKPSTKRNKRSKPAQGPQPNPDFWMDPSARPLAVKFEQLSIHSKRDARIVADLIDNLLAKDAKGNLPTFAYISEDQLDRLANIRFGFGEFQEYLEENGKRGAATAAVFYEALGQMHDSIYETFEKYFGDEGGAE